MDILSLIGVKSAEELGKLIQDGTQELVREKAEQLLDRLMEAELLEFLADAANAVPGEFRNGYYTRLIKTSYGPMELRVPRDRLGCFRTKLLKPYQRTTDELCDLIRDLYVKRGMTANEISDFLLDRYGMEISREKIRTEVNTVLGDAVSFNSRCIPDCAVVFLDGTYVPIKRREPGSSKVEKECVMIALGITKKGEKCVLGFYFTPNEGSGSWQDVIEDLHRRGLYSPALFVTDGLQGMPEAISRVFPLARQQRCLVHIQRNLSRSVRKSDRKEVAEGFQKVYSKATKAEAERELSDFIGKWERTYPRMCRRLSETENLLTFYGYPRAIRRTIYTSNSIESFNSLLKRQTRKRILMNSEGNALITVASVCSSYNSRAHRVRIRAMSGMDEEERASLFIEG